MSDNHHTPKAAPAKDELQETLSALRESEGRLRFLHELNRATEELANADAILAATTQLVGEHLRVSVCAYADMDEDEDGFTIRGDWAAPGSISIVGHYKLADFGKLAVKNLRAKAPLIVNDNLAELAPEEAATFQNIGISATICMPLVKEGRLTALMAIHDKTPRVWTEYELKLIREVTERSWAHVERVGSEAERKASEEELRKLNSDLERQVRERTHERGRAWEISPDLLSVLNHDGTFQSVNPAWHKVLGWSASELAGSFFAHYVHPEDVVPSVEAYQRVVGGEPVSRFENRYRHVDGTWRWLSWAAVSIEGRVYCSARDVTQEKAIKAERDQLWELSQDMLARAGYDGKMSAVNPAWTKVLGYSETHLLTNLYADIIHPDDVKDTVAALAEMGSTQLPTRFENRIRATNGNWKPIGWTVSPEPDGLNFIAVGRDLAADKAREQKLAETQNALRQSQKMEAIGQLTGGVAHDFNNLLMAVLGSLELLRKRMPSEPALYRLLDNAVAGAQRGSALTKRMLAFARRQDLKSERVDLAQLVGGMTELLDRTLGPLITIATEFPKTLPVVYIDPGQLESALLNLAVNARDAMQGQGTIKIWAKEEVVAAGSKLKPGHYVCIAVSDHGDGMDPDTLLRAAEPFFTTKGVGKGTGLGLSMAHGFADQSGGALVLQSAVGTGTTAEIWMPAASEARQSEVSLTAKESTLPTDRKTSLSILAVDDDALVLMNTVAMLEDLGHHVSAANSGPSAIELFKQSNFDLVITDHAMPKMTGAELASELRRYNPKLPIILATGYAELPPGTDVTLPKLSKPFSEADLAEIVRRALGVR